MKSATRILAALLCVLLLLPTVAFAQAQPSLEKQIAQSAEGMSALGGKKGELLKDRELFPAGDSVCDWLAIAMALSGTRESYSDYLAELKAHVEDAYAKNGCLDRNKATEYHRISLTVLALGGNPTNFGTKPDGSQWSGGVENPWNASDVYTASSSYVSGVNMSDMALVTSGNYQRYYVVDGVRYHHLIDPDTLWPARYFDSVSVLSPDSGAADCLTTGLFCMSLEDGQKLIESLDGVEALWCTPDGEVIQSSGWADHEKK